MEMVQQGMNFKHSSEDDVALEDNKYTVTDWALKTANIEPWHGGHKCDVNKNAPVPSTNDCGHCFMLGGALCIFLSIDIPMC